MYGRTLQPLGWTHTDLLGTASGQVGPEPATSRGVARFSGSIGEPSAPSAPEAILMILLSLPKKNPFFFSGIQGFWGLEGPTCSSKMFLFFFCFVSLSDSLVYKVVCFHSTIHYFFSFSFSGATIMATGWPRTKRRRSNGTLALLSKGTKLRCNGCCLLQNQTLARY